MRLLPLVLAALTLCVALPASAARYATYHVNATYLTPLSARAARAIGVAQAPSGREYVVVSFREANRGRGETSVDWSSLTAILSSGLRVQPEYWTEAPPLDSLILAPGASAVGTMSWLVPMGTHRLELRWATGVTYRWTLRF